MRKIKAAATPTSLSFTAAAVIDLEAKGADGKPKLPTFAIRGYTGAVMGVGGFYSPVIVDLGGIKPASQTIPALLDHDSSQIVGQTDSVTVGDDGVDLAGTIMAEDGVADRVTSLARNGFKWQASIGANIVRQEFLKAGEKTQVNGREVNGPLVIVRESKLFEISFVAIGADGATSAAVAAKSTPPASAKGEPTVFEKWLQAKGIDPAALPDAAREFLQATYDAEQEAEAEEKKAAKAKAKAKDKAGPAASLQDIAAERKADLERIDRITAMADAAMDERPAMIDEIKAMADAAIEGKNTVAEFELEMLRLRLNSRSISAKLRSRSDDRVGPKLIEAVVCLSGGLKHPEKYFDQQTLNAASDRYPHGMGLRDLLMLAAREHGYTGYSSTDVRGLLEAAFPRRSDRDIRAEGFSTLSLPGIMSNVANKYLNAGFNAVENSWRTISATRNVRDFKTVTSYALTGGFVYDKVGPGGEFHHATVGELAYTNKADTYGKMFAITRTDIINDDLGALTQVPMKLGRGAALKINDVFWTEFLAVLGTFYTAGRGNLVTGAGSALASAGLQSALLAFRKLTDADGLPTGIVPKYLVTPPELEVTAAELMTSMIVNTGGSSTSTKVPSRNVWENKYTAVSSVYLSNPAYTGSSTTAWYLIADPADLPLIEVAFLNGRETPIVESSEVDFDSLGVQMRGYHDFGVSKQEYRAAVRSAGT